MRIENTLLAKSLNLRRISGRSHKSKGRSVCINNYDASLDGCQALGPARTSNGGSLWPKYSAKLGSKLALASLTSKLAPNVATRLRLHMRHDLIYACSSSAATLTSTREHNSRTREHNSSRSATRKRHRPCPIMTTGSRGPRSVKCLGIEASRPSRSSKYTRSSGTPSLPRNFSNSCPCRGWNGCTTRNRCNNW